MVRSIHHIKPLDSRWEYVVRVDSYGRQVQTTRAKIGARFTKYVVISSGMGSDENAIVQCDCGKTCAVNLRSLRRGKAKGCASCATKRVLFRDIFPLQRLFSIWAHRYTGIISRCYNPTSKAFKNYGAQGISLFEEWKQDRRTFFEYVKTLENWDKEGYDLDRIDNEGNYAPGNIRIVNRKTNARNRRNTPLIFFNGVSKILSDFHKEDCPNFKSLNSIYHHLQRGRTLEEIKKIHDAKGL
jgi:hypothetical protein